MPRRSKSITLRNLRNGLSWRDGRPRWEPSPASRRLGLKGRDLKQPSGAWMERGEAIAIADARAAWASKIRDAAGEGAQGPVAVETLRAALDRLPVPADDAAAWRAALMGDLIDAARACVGRPMAPSQGLRGGERSVARMVAAYFADETLPVSDGTRQAYGTQSRRLLAKFGERGAGGVTRGEAIKWYGELREAGLSPSNRNQCLAAAAAIFDWGSRQEPAWCLASPVTKIRMETAPGRLVFWTMEDERTFVPWCDANGFCDVADGVVAGLWTGASPIDLCAAKLSDLSGTTWRYVRIKTRRLNQIAMPAIMPAFRARIDRRCAQPVTNNAGSFLIDPATGATHTSDSFGQRFRAARAAFVATGEAPDGFGDKRMQDTRDTCVTRLWEAVKDATKLWIWTGHSPRSLQRILREHYIVLRAEGSLAMADELATWAKKEGIGL